jgi:hypothetical protein
LDENSQDSNSDSDSPESSENMQKQACQMITEIKNKVFFLAVVNVFLIMYIQNQIESQTTLVSLNLIGLAFLAFSTY